MQAVDKNEPSILARYLIDLSESFSKFYNQKRSIGEEENTENSRLYLANAVQTVIKTVANLLGIEMPNRM